MSRLFSLLIYLLTTLLGLGAFLYPFWQPALQQGGALAQEAHTGDAPLMLTLLVGICFVVLLLEVQSQAIGAKAIALLGLLVAINATLRFAEVAVPVPGGFSPIFFLIVLAGYVYGARLGFLMGALTLLTSALITGGVGPWLPYQMFTAGWVGMSAPLCRPLVNSLSGEGRLGELVVLAVFGGLWGLLYGMAMNIWFWPFVSGSSALYYQPGIGLAETVERYAAFYIATSLAWDMLRLAGNVLLIALFGLPTLAVLRRFRLRFAFTYVPAPVDEPVPAGRLAPVALRSFERGP